MLAGRWPMPHAYCTRPLLYCPPFPSLQVEIVANDQGNRTTPSYVAFTDTERLIGDSAKNQCAMNPSNTIFGPCVRQCTCHLWIISFNFGVSRLPVPKTTRARVGAGCGGAGRAGRAALWGAALLRGTATTSITL